MSYQIDRWITTTPMDKAHEPECHCRKCHTLHIEFDRVEINAETWPQDFPCCVCEMEDRKEKDEEMLRRNGKI